MAKKKEEVKKEGVDHNLLMQAVQQNAKRSRVMLTSDVTKAWRYIDFCDPIILGKPCLPLEYLFGTRGLLIGRVVKYEGKASSGKTTMTMLHYAMASRSIGAVWSVIFETEGAQLAPDHINSLGCNAKEMLTVETANIDDCLAGVLSAVKSARKSTGSKYPIIITIDSISGLGTTEVDPEGYNSTGTDEEKKDKRGKKKKDEENGKGVGYHARALSKWMRDNSMLLRWNDVCLIVTAQVKDQIPDGFNFNRGSTTTTLADRPTEYYATWTISLESSKLWNDGLKQYIGTSHIMTCTKNKLAPGQRRIKFYLRTFNGVSIDFDEAAYELIKNALLEIEPDKFSASSWVSHTDINGGKATQNKNDFVAAVYANEAILNRVREYYRIRGFGFAFEQIDGVVDSDSYLQEEAAEFTKRTKE